MISFNKFKATLIILSLGIISCKKETKEANTRKQIVIKNTLPEKRNYETIELTKEFLNLNETDSLENYILFKADTNEKVISQVVDSNGDGIIDQLLFQPEIDGNSEMKFNLVKGEKLKSPLRAFSRFVPERLDDYAWENDRVAFRTFGPKIQQMAENNVEGGSISNGIDCWLKKVDYPIIDKWYKANETDPGAYHKDSGEGLDSYHVGSSLGCGGTTLKSEGKYYTSQNFISHRTITTGAIRTQFQLKYKNWDANGKEIRESKIITLDYGNNLSKFEVTILGTDEISAGLTLHDKKGEVIENRENNFVVYWEPHNDSALGTALVSMPDYFKTTEKFEVALPDKSHALIHLKVLENKTVYYAGFGWKEAGKFNTKGAWHKYVMDFSRHLQHPLTVHME